MKKIILLLLLISFNLFSKSIVLELKDNTSIVISEEEYQNLVLKYEKQYLKEVERIKNLKKSLTYLEKQKNISEKILNDTETLLKNSKMEIKLLEDDLIEIIRIKKILESEINELKIYLYFKVFIEEDILEIAKEFKKSYDVIIKNHNEIVIKLNNEKQKYLLLEKQYNFNKENFDKCNEKYKNINSIKIPTLNQFIGFCYKEEK